NAQGGVLGRRIEVVSRDDGGKPGDAVRVAEELLNKEKVVLLAGTYFSHVGLAVSDFARQNKVVFLAAEPLTDALTTSRGNAYTFRLRPSTSMQAAMLAEQAAALPARKWAAVAPNYEYGTAAVNSFKALLQARRPDVEWVAEQFPALGKIDAGAVSQALAAAAPEAIFNATFGPDLSNFVREGNQRGLFRNRGVVSMLTGEPEYLEPLKDEAPEGWIVTGYPYQAIDTPAHKVFRQAYETRFKEPPRLGSVVGYNTFKAIAAAITKAGTTDTPGLVTAMEGLVVETPLGPITFRAGDHQSTMGAFVGKTALRNGKPVMVDWYYADGARYLPPEDEARKLRPRD
ncbi:MAG: ABC transporter substrate-binding protein, partial [Rhodospirillales bacterium]|nr:ABC transporter substrate-binding protein [Rhodospirillales bacterium]